MENWNLLIGSALILAGSFIFIIGICVWASVRRSKKRLQQIKAENKAYADGRTAFAMGIPCEENPYKNDLSQKTRWLKGWWDVLNEHSHIPKAGYLLYKVRVPIHLESEDFKKLYILGGSTNLMLKNVGYGLTFTNETDEGPAVIVYKVPHPDGPGLF